MHVEIRQDGDVVIVDLKGKQCDTEARRKELQTGDEKNESLLWLLIRWHHPLL